MKEWSRFEIHYISSHPLELTDQLSGIWTCLELNAKSSFFDPKIPSELPGLKGKDYWNKSESK